MNICSKMRYRRQQNDDLMMRAAWLYFVEGLTQKKVGEELRIPRIKVTRLIAKARKENKVHVEISHPIVRCLEMEKQLKKIFGLEDAVVVPKPHNSEKLKLFLGKGAARLLDRILRDGQSITVAWGRTLYQVARSVKERNLPRLRVISISGRIPHPSDQNPYDVVEVLTAKLGAQPNYIPAPVFANSVQSKKVIVSQKHISDTLKLAKEADFTLVGVGSVNTDTLLVKAGILNKEDIEHLQAAGAKAEIIAHFMAQDGTVVGKGYSNKVIGLNLSDLQRAKCPICVAGGPEKTEAIRVVLNNHHVKILVTDETTAESLIQNPGSGTRRQEVR